MFRIRYICPYGQLTGYGRASRDYLAALARVDGVALEIGALGDQRTSPEPRYEHLDRFVVPFDGKSSPADVEVVHAPPSVLKALAESRCGTPTRTVAITTWETSHLPVSVADTFRRYHGVIVPSGFCMDALEGSGITRYEVPHGFDEAWWQLHDDEVEDIQNARDAKYRFYAIGAWGERKNILGVVRAYMHAFLPSDRTQLVVLCQGMDYDRLREELATSGVAQRDMPAMHFPDTELEEHELRELHGSADCFVSATRSEGFGLGMFEAAIMGRIVIAPMWGGQYEFLRDYDGHKSVPFHFTPCWGALAREAVVARDGGGGMVQGTVSIAAGTDARQYWAEPDLLTLAKQMRLAYQARSRVSPAQRKRSRRQLEQRFGYKTVGPLLAKTLREICT